MPKKFNNHQLDKALTGTAISNRIQYWSSFEDHKRKIQNEILAEKEEIADCQKNIEELEKELEKVEEQHKFFNLDDYIASYTFSDTMWKTHPDFCKSSLQLIKFHELAHHPKLIGNFIKSTDGWHSSMNTKIPHYEFLGRDNDPFDIHYIRCVDCYKEYLKKGSPNNNHYLMTIGHDPEGK